MERKSLFSRLLFAKRRLLSRSLEFLFEFLNPTSGIKDLLGTGIEGMAVGADACGYFRQGRAGGPFVSACAFYLCVGVIFRVDIRFHEHYSNTGQLILQGLSDNITRVWMNLIL